MSKWQVTVVCGDATHVADVEIPDEWAMTPEDEMDTAEIRAMELLGIEEDPDEIAVQHVG